MIPVRLGIQRPFRYHDTDIASQRKPVIKNLRFHTSLDLLSFYYLRVVQLFSAGEYLGTLTGSATWIERSCTWISASIPVWRRKIEGISASNQMFLSPGVMSGLTLGSLPY